MQTLHLQTQLPQVVHRHLLNPLDCACSAKRNHFLNPKPGALSAVPVIASAGILALTVQIVLLLLSHSAPVTDGQSADVAVLYWLRVKGGMLFHLLDV